MFGVQLPDIMQQYKNELAHKSLQVAVVCANKPQSSGFKENISKVSETTTKPTYAGIYVIVGPYSTRTSIVPQQVRRLLGEILVRSVQRF